MKTPEISTSENWGTDVAYVYQWRVAQLAHWAGTKEGRRDLIGAKRYYAENALPFILDWCDTYDPRNAGTDRPTRMPLLMFERQCELVLMLEDLRANQVGGLIEKARDMGATWTACAYSVWLWLFHPGAAIGWGSRKEPLVDKLGDPDSIFEKIRMLIRGLPRAFWPKGFNPDTNMTFMRIVNPESGATITGEVGDNIGRGGRKSIYFKDESAHYARPDMIEASLADNTNVQVDISSVNGIGNVFYRRRRAGVEWQRGADIDPSKTQVFVMDWRDHPAKTQAWYDLRRTRAENEGLLHVFKQEVDRDYAASVDGIVIQPEWVRACVDAHEKLGIRVTGKKVAGLDVADGGGDKNALAVRHGILLEHCEAWGARDTAVTTRRAVQLCRDKDAENLQYDSIGVGAGVKAEANNLLNDEAYKRHPIKVRFTPWNAGASVLDPEENLIRGDKHLPKNEDHYANLKAQAWGRLRTRIYKTWRAIMALTAEPGDVNHGFQYDPDDLISFSSKIPALESLLMELCQPTWDVNKSMKLLIDKTPDGATSPNLADSVVMSYNPVTPPRKTRRRKVVMG